LVAATEAGSDAGQEPDETPVRDRRFLLGALAVTLVLRLEAFLWPLKPDESGFLLVSRNWHPQADRLYGFLFVDRPPVLIGLFRLSDLLGGAYAPRVAAAILVLVLVYAGHRTGLLLGGVRPARWTAAAAVVLSGQPDLEMWAAKSESLGVPFVMVSCWLSLEALHARPGRRRHLYAVGSGVAGALALGMKQNLIGGAVFGLVLLAVAVGTGRLTFAQARRVAAAAIAGFAMPMVVIVGWVLTTGVGLHTIWDTLYGFRGEAFSVIKHSSMAEPMARLGDLIVLFVVTGIAVVLAWFLGGLRAAVRTHPEATVAAVVMVVLDILGLLLGGSYWTPYLTALFPGTLLAVAVMTSSSQPLARRGMQVVVGACIASMVVYSLGWTVGHLQGRTAPTANYVGHAIEEVAQPGDTIVVLYGRADVVLASGLSTPYEHLWSLPARTLDPHLDELRFVLQGDDAPTWVVAWSALNSWDIDHDGKLQALLAQDYVEAAELCDHHVLLRRGVSRPPLPAVDCDRPWL
jgi:hypothetical protein